MMLVRRLRASLALGAIWATVWLPVGVAMGFWDGWSSFAPTVDGPAAFLGVWTALGFCSGSLFAVLLAAAADRRWLANLAPRRVALWGAIGTAIPLGLAAAIDYINGLRVNSAGALFIAIMTAVGAACAIGTVRLAFRSPRSATMHPTT